MQNKLLADKYPIHLLEIGKNETPHRHLDDIVAVLKAHVEADSTASFIAVFDHHAHTLKIGGEIRPDILAAKNLVFCFGIKLPDPAMLAVRPRSIGIAELPDRFVLSFLEAPMPEANRKMTEWILALPQES